MPFTLQAFPDMITAGGRGLGHDAVRIACEHVLTTRLDDPDGRDAIQARS